MKLLKWSINANSAELIFRSLFSLIFLVAGLQHVFNLEQILQRFGATPWAPMLDSIIPAGGLILMTGLGLMIGGLSLLFGSFTRYASLLLLTLLIPITLTVQLNGHETLGPLFKNIALMGGLIHFAVSGAGYWSMDRFRLQGYRLPVFFSAGKTFSVVMIGAFMLPAALDVPLMAKARIEAGKNERNLAILVREPRHLEVALATAMQGSRGKDSLDLKQTSIVVCGKGGVTGLKKGNSSEALIEEAAGQNIKVIACGLSLKEAGISAGELSEKVAVVDNGLWEMIRLQSEGALSIEL